MIVTLWRHGEAGRAATDQHRELTDTGSDDIGFGCQQLHETCVTRDIPHPDLILYSPWLRTVRTAEIIHSAFNHASARPLVSLQPGSDIPAVDGALLQFQQDATPPVHVVLVSHQPLVSQLVDHYLGEVGSVPFLTPGGLAALELGMPARGCARLLFWAVPPEYEMGL